MECLWLHRESKRGKNGPVFADIYIHTQKSNWKLHELTELNTFRAQIEFIDISAFSGKKESLRTVL